MHSLEDYASIRCGSATVTQILCLIFSTVCPVAAEIIIKALPWMYLTFTVCLELQLANLSLLFLFSRCPKSILRIWQPYSPYTQNWAILFKCYCFPCKLVLLFHLYFKSTTSESTLGSSTNNGVTRD